MPDARPPSHSEARAPRVERAVRQGLTWPLWRLVSSSAAKDLVVRDVDRWVACLGWRFLLQEDDFGRFAWLASALPEFRTLVHFRLNRERRSIRIIARRVWPPLSNLAIHCPSIGGGLFIQHGFATIITAASIGEDCWINQQVTIGWTEQGLPTLGDRVTVGAGAVIVGPVTLGDGVTVGANATVVDDVEPATVVIGPKARAADR